MKPRTHSTWPALPARHIWRHGLRHLAALGVVLAAMVGSFAYLAIDWAGLFSRESMRRMGRFVAEFSQPDLSSAFLLQTGWAAVQTLAVSSVGTLLAVAAGVVLALPASGRFGLAAKVLARMLLNVLRSMPELVWAALMVLAAGLGPMAGCLALALHTTGVLGRLFGETLENLPPAAEQALRQAGARPLEAFAYACLPLAISQWLGYALYRWEMNIRMAAVLGFVGAGGLGQMLHFHLSLFQQAQSMTIMLGIFVLVMGVDTVSASSRMHLSKVPASR